MTYLEAMEARYSRRNYLDTPISSGDIDKLKSAVDQYNKESGLSIQLIEDGHSAFKGILRNYGMFHGVRSFFAMVGNTGEAGLFDRIGYYGELLVLEATMLGLGTCWVGATYSKKHCPCKIGNNETLVCLITVGTVKEKPGLKENLVYLSAHHGGKKSLESLYTADSEVPDWFLAGMKAVRIAPSALNTQPVRAEYKSGSVTIYVEDPCHRNLINLGIAKAHFELAAGGKFGSGNYSAFKKS